MALQEGQIQIRDLVIGIGDAGPATKYRVMSEFNPFLLQARTPGSGERAWGHGGWSGAEWAEPRVVPMTILIRDEAVLTTTGWMEARHELARAFAPIGDTVADVELRFVLGGREYLLLGRPRMVEADTHRIALGHEFVRAAFVALDPLIYSGTETSAGPIDPPTWTGGLTVPFTVPVSIDATQVDGFADLTNAGTADTGMRWTIDGPVTQPKITLKLASDTKTLDLDVDLASGDQIVVDTAARTVLQGTQSLRGKASGDFPLLPPGTTRLEYRVASGAGTLTSTHRDAWW